MPERIDAFPGGQSRVVDLPLDQLLDGGTWMLTPEKDFSGSIASVRAALRAAARRRGLRLRTRVTRVDGLEKLAIQATGDTKANLPADTSADTASKARKT